MLLPAGSVHGRPQLQQPDTKCQVESNPARSCPRRIPPPTLALENRTSVGHCNLFPCLLVFGLLGDLRCGSECVVLAAADNCFFPVKQFTIDLHGIVGCEPLLAFRIWVLYSYMC